MASFQDLPREIVWNVLAPLLTTRALGCFAFTCKENLALIQDKARMVGLYIQPEARLHYFRLLLDNATDRILDVSLYALFTHLPIKTNPGDYLKDDVEFQEPPLGAYGEPPPKPSKIPFNPLKIIEGLKKQLSTFQWSTFDYEVVELKEHTPPEKRLEIENANELMLRVRRRNRYSVFLRLDVVGNTVYGHLFDPEKTASNKVRRVGAYLVPRLKIASESPFEFNVFSLRLGRLGEKITKALNDRNLPAGFDSLDQAEFYEESVANNFHIDDFTTPELKPKMTKAEVLATTVGKGAHVNLTTGRLVNYVRMGNVLGHFNMMFNQPGELSIARFQFDAGVFESDETYLTMVETAKEAIVQFTKAFGEPVLVNAPLSVETVIETARNLRVNGHWGSWWQEDIFIAEWPEVKRRVMIYAADNDLSSVIDLSLAIQPFRI